MMVRLRSPLRSGQALVILLVFVGITAVVTAAGAMVMIAGAQSGSKFELGSQAYMAAEAGAENGLLQILRNPAYTGETLNVGEATAVVTVSGVNPKTLDSIGSISGLSRKIRVVGGYNNGVLTVTSWKEVD